MSNAKSKNDGLLLAIGDMSPGTLISESFLAALLGKHIETIRRWRRNNELPPSVSLGQERVWTVQCLLDHISSRLESLAKQRKEYQQRMDSLSPSKG